MAEPLTDDERATIRAMHTDGASAGAIANHLGRSKDAVCRAAARMGLAWDRAQTAAATAAKVVDNKTRRAKLIADLYDIADDEVAYLRREDGYQLTEVSAGQAVDYTTDRLPAQDRKALVGSISQALSTAVKVEQVDSTGGADAAGSTLGELMVMLAAAHREAETRAAGPVEGGSAG